MTALEIQNLTIEVDGFPIVNNLTLTVEEGERVGILGEHSDTEAVLDVFSGQTLPTSGEIWVYNFPPRQALQRGLIYHATTTQSSLESPVVLITKSPASRLKEASVIIHPIIDLFYELIHESYKMIRLTNSRKGGAES